MSEASAVEAHRALLQAELTAAVEQRTLAAEHAAWLEDREADLILRWKDARDGYARVYASEQRLLATVARVEALVADGSEVPVLRTDEHGSPAWTVTVSDLTAALADLEDDDPWEYNPSMVARPMPDPGRRRGE